MRFGIDTIELIAMEQRPDVSQTGISMFVGKGENELTDLQMTYLAARSPGRNPAHPHTLGSNAGTASTWVVPIPECLRTVTFDSKSTCPEGRW
jgi:hypothetical protein